MLKSERGVIKTKLESKALDIISIDEDEREDNHGQRVVECYPHADFVLDCTNHQTLTESADRLIQIYFGAPFVSPTKDEYASYIANAASYRSLDLSRQVGAAIFGKDCEIISVGCNEVPRAGGGTYWADGISDYRDYAVGYDSNQKVRDDMTRDALVRLQDKGWLAERFANLSPDELVVEAFEPTTTSEPPLRDSMMRDIIEFGRMVHAEMNALADAARFRRSTIDATLYCTTLPCHMCAKLIIAAGIQKVVYIQPYTKSLVEELFEDSVSIDDTSSSEKVHFVSLKGVTPNGFKIAFRKVKRRKDGNGHAVAWDLANARPTFLSNFAYYQPLEIRAVTDFSDAVAKIEKLRPKQRELGLRSSIPKKADPKKAQRKAKAKKKSLKS